jgi:fructose-bisphosphate aldolase class II
MPLVTARDILVNARERQYGVPSPLGGDLEMAIGAIQAAEEKGSPLILCFNQQVTPQVPLELGMPMLVNAAKRARVPVATILDHGPSLRQCLRAIHYGSSSVMYDGSHLPFEENVRKTKEVVDVAHRLGASVEGELGSVGGSALELGRIGPEAVSTDPESAVDFVERTGVDSLAISFGNTHGLYQGDPRIDLDLVRTIHARVSVPLVMHGSSGLDLSVYPEIVAAGISKFNYYSAMSVAAVNDLRLRMENGGQQFELYHEIITWAIEFYRVEMGKLMDILGGSGTIEPFEPLCA